ncbi:hypothetical protein [Nocardia testacea]|uniref:Uncharacterized protein n=1 Tax=Nocardia testacea TaxID=248551 RepID=A0ABW7VTM4_9NOCA
MWFLSAPELMSALSGLSGADELASSKELDAACLTKLSWMFC